MTGEEKSFPLSGTRWQLTVGEPPEAVEKRALLLTVEEKPAAAVLHLRTNLWFHFGMWRDLVAPEVPEFTLGREARRIAYLTHIL